MRRSTGKDGLGDRTALPLGALQGPRSGPVDTPLLLCSVAAALAQPFLLPWGEPRRRAPAPWERTAQLSALNSVVHPCAMSVSGNWVSRKLRFSIAF